MTWSPISRFLVLVLSLSVGSVGLSACDETEEPPVVMEDADLPRRACDYPFNLNVVGYDAVIPPLAWDGAIGLDGQPMLFSLEDFHCQPEYDDYTTLLLVVGAAWCNACPPLFMQIGAQADEFREAGTLLVYMELQTLAHVLATSAQAKEIIDHYIGEETWGMRIGDADGLPEGGVMDQVVTRVPSAYMIRRSDMKVIVDIHLSSPRPNLLEVAQNWEMGWAPNLAPFESNCEEGDEEASEPNDTIDFAAPITPGEMLEGAICNAAPDFYRVDIEGPWSASLYQHIFAHGGVDDLEMHVFNNRLDLVRTTSAKQGIETLEYEGPAYLAVVNYQNSSNTYMVRVESLPPEG